MTVSNAAIDGRAAPLNYFLHSHGPASAATLYLGWVLAAVSVTVCLVIAALLAWAVWRRRPAQARDVVRDPAASLRWVGAGTAISTVILFALTAYALMVLAEVGTPPRAPGLTVAVTGYDWWWRFDYGDAARGTHFVTANELHIPVGVPVRLTLDSADVIHAFWVPQLAGKTQLIPGVSNEQWLQADVPGVYRGQCTQFCGAQHAHMAMEVVAQTPAEFAAWQHAQLADAAPLVPPVENTDLTGKIGRSAFRAVSVGAAPARTVNAQAATAEAPDATDSAAASASASITVVAALRAAGQTLFLDRCGGCHAVRGTRAAGQHGPDLTHLGARRLIAAGLLTNTPAHQLDWIVHAQRYKPGARMPSMALTADEGAALGAYLNTLH